MASFGSEDAWPIKKLRITWSYFSGRPDPYIDVTDPKQIGELHKRLTGLTPLGHPAKKPAFVGGYIFSLPADGQHSATRWFSLYSEEITIRTGDKSECFGDSKQAEKYIKSLFDLPENQRTGSPSAKNFQKDK
ncbi:MAG: hypothetical protein P4L53_12315 [Candidatus Obscuribacterales bacterium]|nr:hypothetical protein [Candidatus Obscuribacterales bacterium]